MTQVERQQATAKGQKEAEGQLRFAAGKVRTAEWRGEAYAVERRKMAQIEVEAFAEEPVRKREERRKQELGESTCLAE